MTKTLSLSDVKTHFPSLVNGVRQRADEVIVTRNGKPAAILLNYEEYQGLQETLEVLASPMMRRMIDTSRKYFRRGGKGLSIEEVFGE